GQIMFMSSSVTYSANSTTSINDSNWHHVLGTYDGDALRIYIDGVLEDTNTAPSGNLPTADGPVRIGADYQATPGNFFNGIIDEVQIHNRALSPEKIKTIYSGTRSDSNYDGCISDPELTAFIDFWHLDSSNPTLKELIEAIGLWKRGCT
ncbi:MAG TPA: LamG domain-containing protein, partial [archaeon]|nr:LamG domain-containing protein [archaeon]